MFTLSIKTPSDSSAANVATDSATKQNQLKQIANRLRIHSMRATTESASGHPTSCMSAAELAAVSFFYAMRFDSSNPKDPRNDRFVLSKGHAAPLLWGVYAEAGILEEKELLDLRKIDSRLEGHPTPRFPWVDVATGSLGQGLSVGVGMAINSQYLDKTNYKTIVLLGDGECAEGSVWEAAALASHYRLNTLIALIDVNYWGQSQETMYKHDLEAFKQKFSSNGWQTLLIDGHDVAQVMSAFDAASREKEKPVAILARTKKGQGVSFLEGKPGFHGKPLSREDLEKAIKEIGDVAKLAITIPKPEGKLPATKNGKVELEKLSYKLGEKVATRFAYGTALVRIGKNNTAVVAVDGDTKNSTYSEKFMQAYPERFFECYIAEQNMIGVAQGLAARGKIPFASTFGAFLARAHDQIRMGGISCLPIKICGSHAGISIGEDGPSQMALEDLSMTRAVPGMAVLYPSDAVCCEKLVCEMANYPGPAFIRTARPATPVLYSNEENFPIGGSKVLKSSAQDQATLVAAGVTLYEALNAYETLKTKGIAVRVIDLYSVKPVDAATLQKAAKETHCVITVEDHYPEGGIGDAVASVLGETGAKLYRLAVDQIPRSGKPEELLKICGIDAAAIVKKVEAVCR
ncbi:MAG: transketolase [Deltaproteobacteria bacterium]|nr:transketolase [Deltaproteobacteria bacterium]